MSTKVKFTFNEVDNYNDPGSSGGLISAMRADEYDATAGIKKHLIEYLKQSPRQRAFFYFKTAKNWPGKPSATEDKL